MTTRAIVEGILLGAVALFCWLGVLGMWRMNEQTQGLVLASLLLVHAVHAPSVYWFENWFPRGSIVLGISFVADPISAELAVLASTLTLLSLMFFWRLVESGSNHFQPLVLIFLAAG